VSVQAKRQNQHRSSVLNRINLSYPEGCKDANDLLVHHVEAHLREIIHVAKPYPVSGLFQAQDFAQEVQQRFDNSDQRGLPTGYCCLDGLYSVKSGRLTVVTGIPGHPRNLVKDQATGGYKVPTMYEISGGAHWRNKADIGLCIHRTRLDSDISEIIIQKNRFSEEGSLGKASLKYICDTEQFEDP
jgi:hypothetical protein